MLAEQQCILVHYGELGLKGKNQPFFHMRLRQNIRRRLDLAGLSWPVEETPTYFVIPLPPDSEPMLDPALKALQQVSGIAWLAPAIRFSHRNFAGEFQAEDFERLYKHLRPMAESLFEPGKTFCVRVKRPNKFVPFISPELAAKLGEWLLEKTSWKLVSVKQPDVTFHLELHKTTAYLFCRRLKGMGGLPTGTAGRVLALLSGGIDSPVAAYLMAKRGCRLDFIHFTASFPEPEKVQEEKVARLGKLLNEFSPGARLFILPYSYFDMALLQSDIEHEVVLFRRFMVRVAAKLAWKVRARALVTGDNLSQVASQTLSNLATTIQVSPLPLLQPLLGFDKDEIIALAEKIGTLGESLKPYKDCCALISRHPRTSSSHKLLTTIEECSLPNYQELIEKTLADAVCIKMD